MPELVNIYQAKTQLSRLVDRALGGEEILIGRAGKPLVRLVRIEDLGPRTPGLLPGVKVPDEVFDPLSDEDLREWE
jgi:antitoxin (DNA-binding transcriptional repressor) of toxin-antitoxin stability system